MGVNQSTEQAQSSLKINHPKFKDIKILKQNDIIRSTITTQHESDYETWQSKLNKTVSIDDEVILLPKAYQFIRKAICGSACTIQIDYDNYPYILADQLQNRREVQRYFSEPQIWYLLYSLVTAAHDFQKLNQRIGDVRPQNIFINQQGHVKVSNLFSWPGQVSNYVKTVYDHQRTYLSPQQAQSARQGRNESYIDKFKSQTFTIGLTVLQTALLRDLDYLYFPNNGFDARTFDKLLKQWWSFTYKYTDESTGKVAERQYSDVLKLVLAAMCEMRPDDRFVSDQVYNWLKKYHQQINELKPFGPGLPPLKNKDKYINLLKKNNQVPVNAGNIGNNGYQVPRDNRYQYEFFKNYANNYSPNFQPQLLPQRPAQIIPPNFDGNIYQQPQQFPIQMNNYLPPLPPQQQPQPQYINNVSTTVSKYTTTQPNQNKQPFYSPPQTQQNNIKYAPYPPTYYNQPPVQPTNTFNNSPQFVLSQPPSTNINPGYKNFSESQVRSQDFLKQIDDKLNKLKQEAA